MIDPNPVESVDVSIFHYFDYERYWQGGIYSRALLLQAVRDQIGDKAFFEFYENYYLAGKSRIATAKFFFSTTGFRSEN